MAAGCLPCFCRVAIRQPMYCLSRVVVAVLRRVQKAIRRLPAAAAASPAAETATPMHPARAVRRRLVGLLLLCFRHAPLPRKAVCNSKGEMELAAMRAEVAAEAVILAAVVAHAK